MRNMLMRFAEKYARFMQGRYGGNDRLNRTLLIAAVIIMFLEAFFPTGAVRSILNLLSLALLFYTIFRTMSKNTYKRYEENRKFEQMWSNLKSLRYYHIYRCPDCGQKIRVPRKHGKKVEIRCPKCSTTFIKKI